MQRSPWHRISIRTEELKFIWDSKRPNHPELYDLKTDAQEKQPVTEKYPCDVTRFQTQVQTHLRQVEQTQPLTAIAQLEFDKDIAKRLRDLGYID